MIAVYSQGCSTVEPSYVKVLSLPLERQPRGTGCSGGASHPGCPWSHRAGQGPAHLLLHQVQRQGRAVGEGGGRRDLLLAALPAQALEVEGGSPMR